MKVITLIISFIFLILSTKPCMDGCEDDHYDDEISCVDDHKHQQTDDCPAICICNCCGMVITNQVSGTFNLKQKISTAIFSVYSSNYRFHFQSNIWQPPQLIS